MNISYNRNHLLSVNHIEPILSDEYGMYYMRCIANIFWYAEDMDYNIFSKYHPSKWTSCYKIINDPTPDTKSVYSSLLVPLESDNLEWFNNNPSCPYIQRTKGKKKILPILAKDTNVQKFLEHYTPCLL